MIAHARDGIAVKRIDTGQHFVEHHTEGEKIGAGILGAAKNLFRAPISGSAAHCGVGLVAGQAGHAEVRELDAIVWGDQYVCRLDVAMDDGATMGDGKSDSNMSSILAGSGKGDAAFGDQFFEGLTFNQFHDEVRSLRGFLNAHVVDGDDGGMRKFADHSRFAKKTSAGVAAGQSRGEQFDRHEAVDQGIMSTNDAAMGAGTQGLHNLITSNLQSE